MISELLTATLTLWLFFIVVATIKNKVFDKDHHFIIKAPMYVLGLVFVVVDVAYNYTYGAILFLEFASNDRKTLTARLKHILHSGDYTGWRFKLALFMCKYMIEPWDFGHCSLHKLEI